MSFNNYGNRLQPTTPIVLNLIIINALAYFAQVVFGGSASPNQVDDLFALHHYKSEVFRPYQLITRLFMHSSFFHLIFNMLALWMFGSLVERLWGPKRFLIFYLICGLGAGLAQMGVYIVDFWQIDQLNLAAGENARYQEILRRVSTLGASGAIMGVLAAFAYLFPNKEMVIFPIPVPVKAKWAVIGMIAIDFFGGVSKVPGDNVAHFAHIGGALVGLLIVFIWNKTNRKTFY